jgi:hypothetical protein
MMPMFCRTPTNPQTNPSDPAIRTVKKAERNIDEDDVFTVVSVIDCKGTISACKT